MSCQSEDLSESYDQLKCGQILNIQIKKIDVEITIYWAKISTFKEYNKITNKPSLLFIFTILEYDLANTFIICINHNLFVQALKTNYGMNLLTINGLLPICCIFRMKISTEMLTGIRMAINFQLKAHSNNNNIANNQQLNMDKPNESKSIGKSYDE